MFPSVFIDNIHEIIPIIPEHLVLLKEKNNKILFCIEY